MLLQILLPACHARSARSRVRPRNLHHAAVRAAMDWRSASAARRSSTLSNSDPAWTGEKQDDLVAHHAFGLETQAIAVETDSGIQVIDVEMVDANLASTQDLAHRARAPINQKDLCEKTAAPVMA